jgi:toluene monooxygenase system protein E
METTSKPPAKLRTWHHLSGQRRRPSEYEIVSTNAHWTDDYWEHPFKSLNPEIAVNQWYVRNRVQSPLRSDDWSAFRDPDEVIYRTYTILQDAQENYVDGLLSRFEDERHDETLAPEWRRVLASLYTPSRYLLHSMQMASTYFCQMAPSTTIGHAAAFQAADQLRWVSHVAYRTRQLADRNPAAGFAADERKQWEELPAWQGFRELAERTLVAYDFGETFVALQLVMKPAVDEALFRELGVSARRSNDMLLALLNDAALRDSDRSRRWTAAFVAHCLKNPDNRAVFQRWIAKWAPFGDRAIEAFCGALPENPEGADRAKKAAAAFRTSVGL